MMVFHLKGFISLLSSLPIEILAVRLSRKVQKILFSRIDGNPKRITLCFNPLCQTLSNAFVTSLRTTNVWCFELVRWLWFVGYGLVVVVPVIDLKPCCLMYDAIIRQICIQSVLNNFCKHFPMEFKQRGRSVIKWMLWVFTIFRKEFNHVFLKGGRKQLTQLNSKH